MIRAIVRLRIRASVCVIPSVSNLFSEARALSTASAPSHSPVQTNSSSASAPTSATCSLINSSSRSLFDQAWAAQIAKRGGIEKLIFPAQIIFLTGAPGAGKGTQLRTIMRERDLQATMEVSSLFQTPVFEAMKATGRLISDADVIAVVIDALLEEKYAGGVVVDGFPRTAGQASAIVLLHEKLAERCAAHVNSSAAIRAATRQPRFTLAVLWCDEAGESIYIFSTSFPP